MNKYVAVNLINPFFIIIFALILSSFIFYFAFFSKEKFKKKLVKFLMLFMFVLASLFIIYSTLIEKFNQPENILKYYNVELIEKKDSYNLSFKQKENKEEIVNVFYLTKRNFKIEKNRNNISLNGCFKKKTSEEELNGYLKKLEIKEQKSTLL